MGPVCVVAVGEHDLPSTVTWQEHSAWPALFLATHLYKPLSSGSAFSMEMEKSEPEERTGNAVNDQLRAQSVPALVSGAQQVSLQTSPFSESQSKGPVGIWLSPLRILQTLLITYLLQKADS